MNIINKIVEKPITLKDATTNECWVQFNAYEGATLFVENIVLKPGNDADSVSFYETLKLQARNTDSDAWVDIDLYSPAHISDYNEIVLNTFRGVATGDLERETQIKTKLYK